MRQLAQGVGTSTSPRLSHSNQTGPVQLARGNEAIEAVVARFAAQRRR